MEFQDVGLTPLLGVGTESTERPRLQIKAETQGDSSNKKPL